jgi:hypothetical protein
MIKFYREYDKSYNTNLFNNFMTEVRNGIRQGFNPLGK